MSELPDYFAYHQENPGGFEIDLYPFDYDHTSKVFTVGPLTIAAHDFDPYKFNAYALGIEDQGVGVEEMPDHAALLPGMSGVIGTPKLHEWAIGHEEKFAEVIEVMHSVYASFMADPDSLKLGRGSAGHVGFAAGNRWHESDYGGIGLQVLGNCACMGPDLQGLFVEGMEHNYAQYDLHNTDSQVQRASIYAGLGHMARQANEAESD